MRIARKLALLTAMALAATALAATNAAATNSVTVNNEDTGDPCNFAEANCQVHAAGESTIFEADGTVRSTCEDEFEGKIRADGTGHITVLVNENHHDGGDCTLQNCTGTPEGAGEDEWPITGTEETGPHEGTMMVRFCLESQRFPNQSGQHCDVAVHVSEPTENSHDYAFSVDNTDDPCPNGDIVVGSWSIEDPTTSGTHDDIEIIH